MIAGHAQCVRLSRLSHGERTMNQELQPQQAAENDEARDREAEAIRGLSTAYTRMRTEIGKVIIGQQEVVIKPLDEMLSSAGGVRSCRR